MFVPQTIPSPGVSNCQDRGWRKPPRALTAPGRARHQAAWRGAPTMTGRRLKASRATGINRPMSPISSRLALAGARGGNRAAEIGEPHPGRAWRPGPFSYLAGAVLASLADLQADGPAPSWLVRVGACFALHFPGANLRLCLDRPGLLSWELGRRLFAILPRPAAKKTHSAAKETHGVIISRRRADFPHLGLRGRSAGRSKCVSCLPEAIITRSGAIR
jgi:hypothetical protein